MQHPLNTRKVLEIETGTIYEIENTTKSSNLSSSTATRKIILKL